MRSLLISMYDEEDAVADTIRRVGHSQHFGYIGVVKSGEALSDKVRDALGASGVAESDHFVLPNMAAECNQYDLPARALCRNFSALFERMPVCETAVVITGDTRIVHMHGINKIIVQMEETEQSIACAIGAGNDFHSADKTLEDLESGNHGGRIQTPETDDFMPQMFIVSEEAQRDFRDIEVVNPWCSEQCLGHAADQWRRLVFSVTAYGFSDGVIYHAK